MKLSTFFNRYFVQPILTVLVLVCGKTYATTFLEPVTIESMTQSADSILIATPVAAVNKRSRQGNLFTEITLSNTQALNNGRFEFTSEVVTIYLWGGVRDENGTPADLTTRPPHIVEYLYGTPNLEFGTQHLFYLVDNGRVGMPFLNSSFGVYKVLSSGRLISNDRMYSLYVGNDREGNVVFEIDSPLSSQTLLQNQELSTADETINIQNATIDDIKAIATELRADFVDPSFNESETRLNSIFVE